MACGCNKNKAAVINGEVVQPGTYRVVVGGHQVYESSDKGAADTVASRFDNATILAPGQTA
jgi:hypothetical protein